MTSRLGAALFGAALFLSFSAGAAELPHPRPVPQGPETGSQAGSETGAQPSPAPRPEEGGIPKLPAPRPLSEKAPDGEAAEPAGEPAPDEPLRPSLDAEEEAGTAAPENAPLERAPAEDTDEGVPSLPEPKDEAAREEAAEAARLAAEKKAEETARKVKETAAAFRQCSASLRALGAKFSEQKPIDEEGGCFVPHPLSVERLLPEIAISPAATLNCATSLALARWLKEVVEPAAAELLDGARPRGLSHASAYVCRHRYGNPDRKISEHAFANAVDLSAITFEDREPVPMKLREPPKAEEETEEAEQAPGEEEPAAEEEEAGKAAKAGEGGAKDAGESAKAASDKPEEASGGDAPAEAAPSKAEREALFQKRIREGACRYFTTVLGPGTNAAHATHFHFDLAQRRNGYRICQ
ncbi:extensin family protein [Afifella sp. IM 167]|uniref:extensin-like domain-containing protein n=1 Tax=Afifella sp. IM 167 TaxID=2033586 RepID=UPI001CD00FCC|nr:hypothetical protein [Afifella sp. IM 167]